LAPLGLTIAYLGLHALRSRGPSSLPRLDEIGVDRAVLVFATAASLVSSLLFGSLPAWKHASNLAANTRGATAAATATGRAACSSCAGCTRPHVARELPA